MVITQQLRFSATDSNVMVLVSSVGPIKALNPQLCTWIIHFGRM